MQPRKLKFTEAVEHFERLPDCALIDIDTLRVLIGKHRNTVSNWVNRGILPKPVELGTYRRAWRVGEIRKALGINLVR
jgi:predicted DNA-binding transcriptional regulator AlpA